MFSQQIVDHARVLHADERPEHAQNTSRYPEVEPDAVRVSRAGAGARTDDQLVLGQIGHKLVDQWKIQLPVRGR
jgi:hypothetical protein